MKKDLSLQTMKMYEENNKKFKNDEMVKYYFKEYKDFLNEGIIKRYIYKINT
jgi:hypothetical protein